MERSTFTAKSPSYAHGHLGNGSATSGSWLSKVFCNHRAKYIKGKFCSGNVQLHGDRLQEFD